MTWVERVLVAVWVCWLVLLAVVFLGGDSLADFKEQFEQKHGRVVTKSQLFRGVAAGLVTLGVAGGLVLLGVRWVVLG